MSVDVLSLDIHANVGDFSLEIAQQFPASGVTAIFGPSGSGKTTLLRMIAGFERPDSGHIQMGDDIWFNSVGAPHKPAHKRPCGYMFQDTRLFAHLNVRGNLDYARKRAPEQTAKFSYQAIIQALDLAPLLDRQIATLSGGESQRVALARTLMTQPRLLLLDEPLAALDSNRKADILPYLRRTLKQFQIPTLYVSHSIDEIAYLADHVLLLNAGKSQAFGPIQSIIERLDLQAVTGQFEAGALVEGLVLRHDERLCLTHVDLDGQTLAMPLLADTSPNDKLKLRIRARDVAIALQRPEDISIRNILDGVLLEIVQHETGPHAELLIDLGKSHLRARLTRAAVEDLQLRPGQKVHALIKSVSFDSRSD